MTEMQQLIGDLQREKAELERRNAELLNAQRELEAELAYHKNRYDAAQAGTIASTSEEIPRQVSPFDARSVGAEPTQVEQVLRSSEPVVRTERLFGFGAEETTGHSVEQRKKTDAELMLLHTCVRCLRDVVMVTDTELLSESGPRILFVNPAFELLTGYSPQEVLGRSPRMLHGPKTSREVLDRMIGSLLKGESVREQLIHYTKSGQEHLIELDVVPITDAEGHLTHYVSVQRDITERKSLETQLWQAQKMEVIGQLAGGVAHDFNNILQVMMLNLDCLALQTDIPPQARAPLQDLEELAERAATVTSQLLMFARRQAVQLHTIDLNTVLAKSVGLLKRLLGEHLTIQMELVETTPWIEADAGMIDQVILNLCINARDAMRTSGTLTLQTSIVDVSEELAQREGRKEGRFVCLSVSDTGCGMSDEVLEHLFEPFFTTKEAGKGTGLGLAAVYGIVMQHHGFVHVESTVGMGSTFRLYLPWSAKMAVRQQRDSQVRQQVQGTQTLLLVEDEEQLRSIAVPLLQRQGYRVLSASDAVEALRLWEQHGHEVDLLISDMVMPGGLTGLELGAKLRHTHPRLKIILMSGYSEEIINQEADPRANISFLAKPFRYQELLDLVRLLLERDERSFPSILPR